MRWNSYYVLFLRMPARTGAKHVVRDGRAHSLEVVVDPSHFWTSRKMKIIDYTLMNRYTQSIYVTVITIDNGMVSGERAGAA